jgi:hypothetical protein
MPVTSRLSASGTNIPLFTSQNIVALLSTTVHFVRSITMRVIEVVIDVYHDLSAQEISLTCIQGFKSYAVRTVISGW